MLAAPVARGASSLIVLAQKRRRHAVVVREPSGLLVAGVGFVLLANQLHREEVVKRALLLLVVLGAALSIGSDPSSAQCGNPIACENARCRAIFRARWDITGAGGIRPFRASPTDISVDQGQTVHFKIESTGAHHINIYRMGYYGGRGARFIRRRSRRSRPNRSRGVCPTPRPASLIAATGRSPRRGTVPATAVPGIYFAKLIQESGGGSSHVVFVVRDDDGAFRSAVPDVGHDVAGLQPVRRQQPVRRDRHQPAAPTRSATTVRSRRAARHPRTGSSTPSTRWCGGSSRTATTSATTDRRRHRSRGAQAARTTKSFLSVGHDEYWSAGSAPTSKPHAMPASISRSSAATKCSGRRGGRTQHRRVARAVSHARHLQGNAREREDRSAGPLTVDGHVARPALAVHPPTAAEPRTRSPARSSRSTAATSDRFSCLSADGKMRFWRNTTVATLAPRAPPRRCPTARSATNGMRISTTDSRPRRIGFGSSTTTVTTCRVHPGSTWLELRRRAPRRITSLYRRRAARSSSAPAPSSGSGASTAITISPAPGRATCGCSRRR